MLRRGFDPGGAYRPSAATAWTRNPAQGARKKPIREQSSALPVDAVTAR